MLWLKLAFEWSRIFFYGPLYTEANPFLPLKLTKVVRQAQTCRHKCAENTCANLSGVQNFVENAWQKSKTYLEFIKQRFDFLYNT